MNEDKLIAVIRHDRSHVEYTLAELFTVDGELYARDLPNVDEYDDYGRFDDETSARRIARRDFKRVHPDVMRELPPVLWRVVPVDK
jgi:hypothetical protein